MDIIKGLIMAARLMNKEVTGALEDDRAQFQIGDVHLNIYEGGPDEGQVTITPTSMDMWYQPFYVEGTLESVFYAVVDMIDETAVDYEDSLCRQMFPNLECLVEYIEKETGVVAEEHPKCYTEKWNGIMEFQEFKIIFFGPYHGTVYVPEDYKLNFILNELP